MKSKSINEPVKPKEARDNNLFKQKIKKKPKPQTSKNSIFDLTNLEKRSMNVNKKIYSDVIVHDPSLSPIRNVLELNKSNGTNDISVAFEQKILTDLKNPVKLKRDQINFSTFRQKERGYSDSGDTKVDYNSSINDDVSVFSGRMTSNEQFASITQSDMNLKGN
jgi:hypothetical protein